MIIARGLHKQFEIGSDQQLLDKLRGPEEIFKCRLRLLLKLIDLEGAAGMQIYYAIPTSMGKSIIFF